MALLSVFILWGAFAYAVQFYEGLGVTGLQQPVSWGFYVTNFVFFIGISHAGTLISAILRLSRAEWRRPITRMAEVITAMVLLVGAGQILVDLGPARPNPKRHTSRPLSVTSALGRHQHQRLFVGQSHLPVPADDS